jgi:predicted membrane protein
MHNRIRNPTIMLLLITLLFLWLLFETTSYLLTLIWLLFFCGLVYVRYVFLEPIPTIVPVISPFRVDDSELEENKRQNEIMRSEERRRDTRRKKKNNYLTAKEKIKSEKNLELLYLIKEEHEHAKLKLRERYESNARIVRVIYEDKVKAEKEADNKEESLIPLIRRLAYQKNREKKDKLKIEYYEKMIEAHQERMRNVHQHIQ